MKHKTGSVVTNQKIFLQKCSKLLLKTVKTVALYFGTAQNFYLLAKAIRSQCTEVRRCATYFGALTIVRRFEPILDSDGNVKEFVKKGWYFYVHDKELRNSYDTYHVIDSLNESGFKESADFLAGNEGEHINSIIVLNTNKK